MSDKTDTQNNAAPGVSVAPDYPVAPHVPMAEAGEAPGFFDKPSTRRAIWIILIALCAGFGLAGLILDMHGYFPVEEFGLFYGLFGFAVFSFIVLVGQHLRKILMRPEDYYDEQ